MMHNAMNVKENRQQALGRPSSVLEISDSYNVENVEKSLQCLHEGFAHPDVAAVNLLLFQKLSGTLQNPFYNTGTF